MRDGISTSPTVQDTDPVAEYLEIVTRDLGWRAPAKATRFSPETVADAAFELLTARRYGHLGRRRSEPFRPGVVRRLRRDVVGQRPLRFYFDLGPGYHASLAPGREPVSHDVGLGELLALRQVVMFCNEVRTFYPAGARFHLVIDNLCGWATNDIPLERSLEYVDRLRALIREVRAEDLVDVLVESENTSPETYAIRLAELTTGERPAIVPEEAIENVARFLGRPCDGEEARDRIERYDRTTVVTEELLEPAIRGVRLTQRASAATLGFRAFPGGDQRIQVGQVALTEKSNGGAKAILLTSRNAAAFDVTARETSPMVPRTVGEVLVATPSLR